MFPFDEVKNILIPIPGEDFQKYIQQKYTNMNEYNNRWIALREKGDDSFGIIKEKANNILEEILSSIEELIKSPPK
jgi:hypothetical protein